jgi:hypothetical protein
MELSDLYRASPSDSQMGWGHRRRLDEDATIQAGGIKGQNMRDPGLLPRSRISIFRSMMV